MRTQNNDKIETEQERNKPKTPQEKARDQQLSDERMAYKTAEDEFKRERQMNRRHRSSTNADPGLNLNPATIIFGVLIVYVAWIQFSESKHPPRS